MQEDSYVFLLLQIPLKSVYFLYESFPHRRGGLKRRKVSQIFLPFNLSQ